MRALVVDDSTLFRKVVRDALGELPGVEVVGVAANGKLALERIATLKPDLVTLDLEMPELDGLGVLEALSSMPAAPTVIMVSALTATGAETTMRALRLGAFDFILKPAGNSVEENCAALRQSLAPIIETLARLRSAAPTPSHVAAADCERAPSSTTAVLGLPPSLIVIGVSTGGPAALAKLLPSLPTGLPPILIVQHMPPVFTKSLADQLNRSCTLTVVEGSDGVECQPGCAYIAPGGFQMGVQRVDRQLRLFVNDDPPERNCRPAVDYLFRSAAKAVGGRCLAAVLTGMGDDGQAGAAILKSEGARVVAQDEATSVVYGMPRCVIASGLADDVLPLTDIGQYIQSVCNPEGVLCR